MRSILLSIVLFAAACAADVLLRGPVDHAEGEQDLQPRILLIHFIPVIIAAAHGAGHAVITGLAHAAHLSLHTGHASLQFTSKKITYKLGNEEVKEQVYEEFCKEIIDHAWKSTEHAIEAINTLKEAFPNEAVDLTIEQVRNLQCSYKASSKKKNGCLWGGNEVLLAGDEGQRLVRDLAVGDLVVTADGHEEPVLALLPHADQNEKFPMIALVLKDGSSIVATPDHLLPVEGRGTIPFSQVEVGDALLSEDGRLILVMRKTSRLDHGVYSPLTPSCTMLVQGVVVSCASEAMIGVALLKAVLWPVHQLHKVLPLAVYSQVHDRAFVPLYAALVRYLLTFSSGLALLGVGAGLAAHGHRCKRKEA